MRQRGYKPGRHARLLVRMSMQAHRAAVPAAWRHAPYVRVRALTVCRVVLTLLCKAGCALKKSRYCWMRAVLRRTSLTSCRTKPEPNVVKAFSGHSMGPTGPLLLPRLPAGGCSSTSYSTRRCTTSCQSARATRRETRRWCIRTPTAGYRRCRKPTYLAPCTPCPVHARCC